MINRHSLLSSQLILDASKEISKYLVFVFHSLNRQKKKLVEHEMNIMAQKFQLQILSGS